MIFDIKNIGPIKDAQVELGDLTVVCGKNNTGKTYITYSIFGFLENYLDLFLQSCLSPENLSGDGRDIIKINLESFTDSNRINKLASEYYKNRLHHIFSSNENEFENSSIYFSHTYDLSFDYHYLKTLNGKKINIFTITYSDIKNELQFISHKKNDNSGIALFESFRSITDVTLEALKINPIPLAPFILSAERTNTRLFLNEIDKNRSVLINELMKQDPSKINGILKDKVGRYALPIQKNLDFARDIEQVIKNNSFLQKEHPQIIKYIEQMLGIEYVVNDGQVLVRDKKAKKTLPYYMASTSVRTLSDLHFWIKHQATKNSILFIDEPELNLHPENQIKIARLLVKLVNAGIKVFITTHSDYIIKELNNLLSLENDFPEKKALMKQFGYAKDEILAAEKLKTYIVKDGVVNLVKTDELGMIESGFDEAIVQINEISNSIANAIEKQTV